jgi:hypothetical protein
VNRQGKKVNISNIDVEELLETTLPEVVTNFLSVVRDMVLNRRTFLGKKINSHKDDKLGGLIPPQAQEGDSICILYGCSVPVVLRKSLGANGSHYWELVGEAYVHGLMDGEALRGLTDKARREREIEFDMR